STVFPAPTLNAAIGMRLTNSSSGTAQNRACRSARLWSSGAGCIWSRAVSLLAPSIFVSERRPSCVRGGRLWAAQRRLGSGIRRGRGVKKLGERLGDWLTVEQGQALWQAPDRAQIKGKRDRALLALLLACGLRCHELAGDPAVSRR